jgi:hypothetical protein
MPPRPPGSGNGRLIPGEAAAFDYGSSVQATRVALKLADVP